MKWGPPTKLARLIAARDRYLAWARENGPSGGHYDHWLAWREWVDARRGQFADEIAKARDEKRFNQRSKANERKLTEPTTRANRGRA
jgi:hypothetical protein